MMPHNPCVFTALILITGVSSLVLPPENVTISCQNFQTTLSWNHRDLVSAADFRLKILSSSVGQVTVTKDHHYDLTPFIWLSPKHYMAIYWVNISATDGTEESQEVQSSTFSFNEMRTVHKLCELDFPPARLSLNGQTATVSFPNPYHFYKHLNLSTLRDYRPVFHFKYSQTGEEWTCTIDESICKHHIVFAEEGNCVMLEGWMTDKIYFPVNRVLFKKTQICVHEEENNIMPYIILSVVPVLAFFVIIILIWAIKMTKGWKITPSSLSQTLATKLSSSPKKRLLYVEHEHLSRVYAVAGETDGIETERTFSTAIGPMCTEGGSSGSNQPMAEQEDVASGMERHEAGYIDDATVLEFRPEEEEEEEKEEEEEDEDEEEEEEFRHVYERRH